MNFIDMIRSKTKAANEKAMAERVDRLPDAIKATKLQITHVAENGGSYYVPYSNDEDYDLIVEFAEELVAEFTMMGFDCDNDEGLYIRWGNAG